MAEQQQQQVALQMQRNVFMRQNPHYQPNGNPLSANPVAANAVPHRRRRPRQAPQEAQGLLPQDIQPSVMPATRHNENTLGRAPVSNGLIPAGLGSSAAMPMPIPSTSRAASAMPFEPARGASRQQQFGPLINPYAPYRSRAASADGDFARPAQSSSAPASLDSFAHLPQQLATPEFAAAPSRPSQLPVEQQNARFAALLRGDRTPMEEDEGEMDEEGYDEEEGADHALAVMRSSGRRHFQQQHSVQNRPW